MAKNNSETIIIHSGANKVECDILFSFDCVENGKSYIVCTDHSLDDEGRENLYPFSYIPDTEYEELRMVTTPIELEMIQDVISQIRKK